MSQTMNDILNNIGSLSNKSRTKVASNEQENQGKKSLSEILASQMQKSASNNEYIHRPLSGTTQKVASLNKQAEEEDKFGRILGHIFNDKVTEALVEHSFTKIASEIAETHNVSQDEAEEYLNEALSPNHLPNDLRPAAPVSNSAYYHDQDALNLAVEKELLSRQLANPSSAEPGNGILI